MNQYHILKKICLAVGIILSNIMCARVSYVYCTVQWAAKYEGWSVSTGVAFLYAIPFMIGILFCIILYWIFHKKQIRFS